MEIKKIPLEERISRMQKGFAGHPEYITSAIRSMGNIPVSVYLNSFPEERERLREILGITEEEEGKMTYQEAAARISQIRSCREKDTPGFGALREWNVTKEANEVIRLLAAPFKKCHEEERKRIYGK